LAKAEGESERANGTILTRRAEPTELKVRFLARNLPIVAGKVGGRDVNILIDTGTSPAIADTKLARALGLEKLPGYLQVLEGTVPTPGTWIPDVEVGPVRQHRVAGLIRDLSHLKEQYGMSVGAIVGLDFLADQKFRLDYVRGTLTFGEAAKEGVAVLIDENFPFPVVTARVQKRQLRLLIDTGASDLVLFRERLDSRDAHYWNTRRASLSNLGGRTKAGALSNISLRLEIGGMAARAENLFIVSDKGQFKEFDGLLAVRSAGFRSLSYDGASRTLYLQR
jgi:hypothetical protein